MIIAVRLGALTRPGDFKFHLPNLISLPSLTVLMNSPGSCQVLIRHLSSCVFFADVICFVRDVINELGIIEPTVKILF